MKPSDIINRYAAAIGEASIRYNKRKIEEEFGAFAEVLGIDDETMEISIEEAKKKCLPAAIIMYLDLMYKFDLIQHPQEIDEGFSKITDKELTEMVLAQIKTIQTMRDVLNKKKKDDTDERK